MSSIYEKFYSNLYNFKATVQIKNLAIIRFWTDLTSLVAEKGDIQMNFLFKCSVQAQKIDGDNENDNNEIAFKKPTSFIEDIGFINMVLVFYETGGRTLLVPTVIMNGADNEDENEDMDTGINEAGDGTASEEENEIVEHELINLDDRTIKFLASFFTIILETNFKRLPIVAERFEMPQYESLYRYSSSIFTEITRRTNILRIVYDFRNSIQNGDIEVDVANDMINLNISYIH
jgi:hypothetical protein